MRKVIALWVPPNRPGVPYLPFIDLTLGEHSTVDITMRQSSEHGAPATIVVVMKMGEFLRLIDDINEWIESR